MIFKTLHDLLHCIFIRSTRSNRLVTMFNNKHRFILINASGFEPEEVNKIKMVCHKKAMIRRNDAAYTLSLIQR